MQVLTMFFGLLFSVFVFADELPLYKIVIKDHQFIPDTIKVKADQKFRLEVKNEDAGSEEFESATMHIEKIVGPKKTLRLVLGPLKKGTYSFMGEFHQATAQGNVIAE
jgi:hypothetical protein